MSLIQQFKCGVAINDSPDSEFFLKKYADLPVPYFLVTFTVPASLRKLAWHHQRVFFSCLFDASAYALRALAGNEKFLGGTPGMTGVLHTNFRGLLTLIQLLLRARPAQVNLPERPAFKCPDCGSAMAMKGFRGPASSRSPPAVPLHLHN